MTTANHVPAAEYLADHPLLRTGDLDEARHRVAQKFCDHRLAIEGRGTALSVRHNHVAGRNISINYLRYGADVHIDPGFLGSFYLLQIPLLGHARVEHRGVEIMACSRTATLLNPDRDTRMLWHADCRKLLLQIDKAHLEAAARELVGAPLPGPVRFKPDVDLSNAHGRRLRRMVLTCATAIEQGQLFKGQVRAHELRVEQDLALALLIHQESNITHIIDRSDHRPASRGIRAAVDYIHGNVAEPISLACIARHAGMNIRTLQKGFQRAFGLSPMQMLKNARLDAAHYQLYAREEPQSVTSVAFANGFSHLGRFSRDYRERFGHLPSKRH